MHQFGVTDQNLLGDPRPHGVAQDRHLVQTQALHQARHIIGHLRDGGVVLRRISGQADPPVVEQDQLVLAGQLLDQGRVPQAHGGEEAVDHH